MLAAESILDKCAPEDLGSLLRLLGNCRACEETGCWNWLGGMGGTEKSTPVFHFPRGDKRKRSMAAYKALWIIAGKAVPDGHLIYRGCLNHKCVNPDHCKAGTTKEMWKHIAKTGKFKANPHRKVANRINVGSMMTPEPIIRQIEALLAEGITRNEIAERLDIDKHVVTQVRQGRHFFCSTRPRVLRGASVFAL